jgi:hypothetical protein
LTVVCGIGNISYDYTGVVNQKGCVSAVCSTSTA